MIIDAHACFGPSLADRSDAFGALWPLVEARHLVELMDEAGIDKAIVFAPAWCGGDDLFDPEYQRANDAIFEGVGKYPDRLIGFARVNPRYGVRASQELDRCFEQYNARGLMLDQEADGFIATDDRLLWPLMERCAARGAVPFFKTGFPPRQPGTILPWIERFPQMNFIIGHAGLRIGADAVQMARRQPNVFLETSHQTTSLLNVVMKGISVDRLLFGSAVPFSIPRAEIHKITAISKITPREQDLILGGNAARILGLAGSLSPELVQGVESDGYFSTP